MEQVKTDKTNVDSVIPTEYAYITRTDGIRGGNPIVAGTGIGVHDVVGLLQNGETIDTVVTQSFPDLTRAQVYECHRLLRRSSRRD